jgi:threonyl-tRNA synthetase
MAPVQASILSMTDRSEAYCNELWSRLIEEGIRPSLDLRSEKMGRKIRDAQLDKVPYMLIVGDKEIETGTVAVRDRRLGDIGVMSVEDFIKRVKSEVKALKLD